MTAGVHQVDVDDSSYIIIRVYYSVYITAYNNNNNTQQVINNVGTMASLKCKLTLHVQVYLFGISKK